MVAWDRRFNPFILEARRLVEERGPIAQVVAEFHNSLTNMEASQRFAEIILDNFMLETSSHAIDLVRSLGACDIAEVHSVVQRRYHDYRDVHAALVRFENGCVAQISANFTGAGRLERYEIHGRDISAYLEGVQGGEVVCDGERHEIRGDGPSSLEAQDRFFIDCIKEGRAIELPAANLDAAVKTMELCDAIRQASQ
jgi:predicted dehydrogenase